MWFDTMYFPLILYDLYPNDVMNVPCAIVVKLVNVFILQIRNASIRRLLLWLHFPMRQETIN